VRRLVKRMGLEDLIESVRLARRDVPDLLVLIAGKGPLAKQLESRGRDPEIAPHLRMLGFLPDEQLPLAYRAADLTVVPSVALEGFGLVVAESLSAGTPVLVTAVGGLPETIEELAPECVVQEAGARALAAGIADALLGKLPLPSAEACRRFARERYDWRIVAGKVRDVYTEAAS
jgi:glycosyltransferase involved in cell wall biosynthesis